MPWQVGELEDRSFQARGQKEDSGFQKVGTVW